MGSRASGKSTLIRQLKSAHDTIDVEEASRFAREARKVALELVKQTANEVAPIISDPDAKKAAERLMGLRRRAQVVPEVLADVRKVWQSPEVKTFEEQLSDVQRRKACRHYVQRLEALAQDSYVPETLDLLHMALPTVGQQETRVSSFPGGELNLVELCFDESHAFPLVNQAPKSPVRTRAYQTPACDVELRQPPWP